MQWKDRISELVDMAEFQSTLTSMDVCKTYYYDEKEVIFFNGIEKITKLNNHLDHFWKWDREVHRTVSLTPIEEAVIKIIIDSYKNKAVPEETTIKNILITLFNELKRRKLQKYEVIYDLSGGGWIEYVSELPFEVGPFKIYSGSKHKQVLAKTYPHATFLLNMHKQKYPGREYISTTVEARDDITANEKAKRRFKQFDDIMSFMIADLNIREDIDIKNISLANKSEILIFTDDRATSKQVARTLIPMLPTLIFPINNSNLGHDKIWGILTKENPTDMEKRILTAIGWIGKGLRDEEPSRSFVQFMIALESLFQFNKEKSFISPSISNQISEFSAFINGDNLDERIQIESEVKKLYGIRSKIAHSGFNEVNEIDRYRALILVKTLVHNLIVSKELGQLQSVGQLDEWVKKKRYSETDSREKSVKPIVKRLKI